MSETRTAGRSGTAVATAIVLVGLAAALAWFSVAPGIFGGSDEGALDAGTPVEVLSAAAADSGLVGSIRIVGAFQGSQPRDPFAPLIEPTTTTQPGDTTTTTQPGDTTTTTQPGDTTTTTTTPGATTTTTSGFEPEGNRVALVAINVADDGELEAVVTVDGEEFVVREGETFATDFKVVTLDEDGGVFLKGDKAFTLAVGEEILK